MAEGREEKNGGTGKEDLSSPTKRRRER